MDVGNAGPEVSRTVLQWILEYACSREITGVIQAVRDQFGKDKLPRGHAETRLKIAVLYQLLKSRKALLEQSKPCIDMFQSVCFMVADKSCNSDFFNLQCELKVQALLELAEQTSQQANFVFDFRTEQAFKQRAEEILLHALEDASSNTKEDRRKRDMLKDALFEIVVYFKQKHSMAIRSQRLASSFEKAHNWKRASAYVKAFITDHVENSLPPTVLEELEMSVEEELGAVGPDQRSEERIQLGIERVNGLPLPPDEDEDSQKVGNREDEEEREQEQVGEKEGEEEEEERWSLGDEKKHSEERTLGALRGLLSGGGGQETEQLDQFTSKGGEGVVSDSQTESEMEQEFLTQLPSQGGGEGEETKRKKGGLATRKRPREGEVSDGGTTEEEEGEGEREDALLEEIDSEEGGGEFVKKEGKPDKTRTITGWIKKKKGKRDDISPAPDTGMYRCNERGCNKSYKHQASLQYHLNTHNNVFPFKCEFRNCGKAFSDPSNLRTHAKKHGTAKFKCKHCQRGFHWKDGLQKHLASAH